MKRSDATRRALLAAARDEFAEYGLAGARVDRVAELAGVNKERIYSLFGSKEKLFDAIIVDTLQEFTSLVDPLDTETDLGDYVAKLFDFHRGHPQLQRLLLWEALHRGDEAHDIDGWRVAHYRNKVVAAMGRFGVDERHAGLLVLAMACLANWHNATPQQSRLLLGELADDQETIRDFLAEFVRTAMRAHEAELAEAARAERSGAADAGLGASAEGAVSAGQAVSSALAGPADGAGARAGSSADQADGAAPADPVSGAGTRPGSSADGVAPANPADSGPVNPLTDNVDRAARQLRDAQAAADAARAELGRRLRAANAAGDSANQLAKQVAGTLSRPVVLKLLAED